MFRDHTNTRHEYATLIDLLLLREGYPKQAVRQFEQVVQEQRAQGDVVELARTLTNYGTALARAGNQQGAIERHSEAIEIARREGKRLLLGGALLNLSIAHAMSHSGEAEGHCAEALRIAQELCDAPGEAIALATLGRILVETRPDDAIHYLEQALAMYEGEIPDNYNAARACLRLSEIHRDRDRSRAIGYALQARQFADKSRDLPGTELANKMLDALGYRRM